MAKRSKESNTQVTKKTENNVVHRNNFKYYLTLLVSRQTLFFLPLTETKKMKFEGYRVCPNCGKEGKMLPKSNNNPNSLIRSYICQSCYWSGPMFKAIKKHSFLEYYFLLLGLIVLIISAMAGFFYLLTKLPD